MLFIGTLMVAVQEDMGIVFLHRPILISSSHVTLDVFGLLCFIGVMRASHIVAMSSNRPGSTIAREDLIILSGVSCGVGAAGFLVEGARALAPRN